MTMSSRFALAVVVVSMWSMAAIEPADAAAEARRLTFADSSGQSVFIVTEGGSSVPLVVEPPSRAFDERVLWAFRTGRHRLSAGTITTGHGA